MDNQLLPLPRLCPRLAVCPLQEDNGWREQLSFVTGPVDQDMKPPLERQVWRASRCVCLLCHDAQSVCSAAFLMCLQGLLWDWYRQLHRDGWKLDSNSYSTCFRCCTVNIWPAANTGPALGTGTCPALGTRPAHAPATRAHKRCCLPAAAVLLVMSAG